MKGFILAAGFGQRMQPITETVPKPLLPVGGLPLIVFSIRLLAHHGIKDIIINVHYLADAIKEALGDGSEFGVKITFSHEEEILGTGGGLKRMDSLIDETCVVINSDMIVDLDLNKVVVEHRRRGALATMVLREPEPNENFGLIDMDSEGRITGILREELGLQGQTQPPVSPARRLMFCGVHVIEPRFLEYIPKDVNTCVVRYGYVKALTNHEALRAHVTQGLWLDAGTPERYLTANRMALGHQLTLPHADALAGFAHSPRRTVAEVARLGEDVRLGDGVRLAPPVLIGDGCRLGERAVVGPNVVVGRNVTIGRDAHISQSVVLDGAKIDASTRLERAIVGRRHVLDVGRADTTNPTPDAPSKA